MSTAPRQSKPDLRFSASHPCPVCGSHDDAQRGQGERCYGFLSGEWIHCTREQFAGGENRFHPESKTFSHKAAGPCPCGQEHRPAVAGSGARVKLVEVASFDYPDSSGNLLYQVVKFLPKTFRQRRPAEGGGWTWDLKGVSPVLYRLPELLAADPGEPVFIVEGEKDADRLAKFGLVATTNSGGAGKWKDRYASCLKGRDVVIVTDNDQPGRDHGQQVARSLFHAGARSVKVVALPGLPEKGDVSDWLDRGRTIADLKREAAEAPTWSPGAEKAEEAPPTIPIRPDDDRPLIVCGTQAVDEGLKKWTPLALEALASRNRRSPEVFQRGGKLCRMKRPDQDAPPIIEPLCLDALRGVLDRSAFYAAEVMTKSGPKLRFGPPRIEIPKDIMALPRLDPEQFHQIDGVTETPRFSADGRLILEPGYDPGSRMFYAPSPSLDGLEVPDRPTPDQVREAKALIVDDLLKDFPFKCQASRANAVGAMLTPFVRLMISGATPNHHFTAATEGTGKGLCAAACCYPFLGREPDLNAQKESEAEWRKALTSFFVSGGSHYFIDNMYNPPGWDDVPQDVASGTLAMAWTAPYWQDRLLGSNEQARIKVLSVFMSSGNNVVFSRELQRRLVLIELVAHDEVPSLRTGFRHNPLMDFARDNRSALARACLILCRHWIAEGKPEGGQVMGSYESYAKTIGGILGACGIDGFLANRPKAVKRDREATSWGGLIAEWHRQRLEGPVTTADIWGIITGDGDGLGAMFQELLGDGTAASQKIRLGKALERHEGRVWGNWRIGRSVMKTANKVVAWKLLPKADSYSEDEDEEDDGDRGRQIDPNPVS